MALWKGVAALVLAASSYAFAHSRPFVAHADADADASVEPQKPLRIWIAAHSHDDAGWLRTVDEYFAYEVQYILDTVIENLYVNPKRKFIEVEIAFFSRWWADQDAVVRNVTRNLVKNGQLEFVYGGWVMPDEACPTYDAFVEELTIGHEFIIREFGAQARPKVGWSIDPFGSTSTLPTILKQAGYENLIINRMDYRTKQTLFKEKRMEFFWQGSDSLGKKAELFTHVMDNHYCTPNGFDWEHGVSQALPDGDGPPVIIREGHEPSPFTKANALERATEFVKEARRRAAGFPTNNILIPFGCDFNFQNADMKFKNMDNLIDTINEYSKELGAVASYSTLSDYFNAVRSELSESKFPVYTNDFYPYADGSESYWTGYFTSRPLSKQLNREGASYLKNAEIFLSWTTGFKSMNRAAFAAQTDKLEIARKAQSLFQHHDGITGTERKDVDADYAVRMSTGIKQSKSVLVEAMTQIRTGFEDGNPRDKPLVSVDNLVFTSDQAEVSTALKMGSTVAVRVLESNGFGANVQYMRIAGLPRRDLVVKLARTNAVVPFQVTPSELLERRDTLFDAELTFDLVFLVKDVPAMGFDTFLIIPGAAPADQVLGRARTVKPVEPLVLANEHIAIRFDAVTGLPLQARSRNERSSTGEPIPAWETTLGFSLINYPPSTESQTSGPYIFRPATNIPTVLTTSKPDSEPVVFEGPLFTEVRSSFGKGKYLTKFVAFNSLPELEGSALYVDIVSGPLDVNTDLFATFKTDVDTLGKFYTDDNAYEFEERTIFPSGRPGDRDSGVAVAGNFYPVAAFAFIKPSLAQKPRVTLLTRRTHAVGAVTAGELQVGLHRRFSRDDGRGVGEPLDDKDVVRSQFVLSFSKEDGRAARAIRQLGPSIQFPMNMVFELGNLARNLPTSLLRFEPISFGGIPPNVRMMTLRPLTDGNGELVVRFTNIFEKGEDSVLGAAAKVDLDRIFARFEIEYVLEKSLTLLSDIVVLPRAPRVFEIDNKEIKTFVVKLNPKL